MSAARNPVISSDHPRAGELWKAIPLAFGDEFVVLYYDPDFHNPLDEVTHNIEQMLIPVGTHVFIVDSWVVKDPDRQFSDEGVDWLRVTLLFREKVYTGMWFYPEVWECRFVKETAV